MSTCATQGQLRKYSERYGVEATLCNNGSAVALMGDAFDVCLLEMGMRDRKIYEFIKETLIKKDCPSEIVSFMEKLKSAMP